jgi:hypothetical protein
MNDEAIQYALHLLCERYPFLAPVPAGTYALRLSGVPPPFDQLPADAPRLRLEVTVTATEHEQTNTPDPTRPILWCVERVMGDDIRLRCDKEGTIYGLDAAAATALATLIDALLVQFHDADVPPAVPEDAVEALADLRERVGVLPEEYIEQGGNYRGWCMWCTRARAVHSCKECHRQTFCLQCHSDYYNGSWGNTLPCPGCLCKRAHFAL